MLVTRSMSSLIFLSTPSARRATTGTQHRCSGAAISIHALCEEGDASASSTSTAPQNFYPRPLRGGRPIRRRFYIGVVKFLSTPSARRATPMRPSVPMP